MNQNIQGTNWTFDEVSFCVDKYFQCLAMDIQNQSFNKSAVYRELAAESGRSTKSIERKFQNISAILDKLGFEWISGLAPLHNYQGILAQAIEAKLPELHDFSPRPQNNFLHDPQTLFLDPPPKRDIIAPELPEYMERMIRKFDPVARDLKLKQIGDAGEKLAFENEQTRLRMEGRSDLARKVRWISKEDGDGAGYDILSFDQSGEKSFVEVKTTIGGSRTPFFLSRNEKSFAEEESKRFRLLRLYDFRKAPRAFELRPPLEDHVKLMAENFRAEFIV